MKHQLEHKLIEREYIYRAYPPVSFSSGMLARRPQQLAVIELDGVEWSDWGRPERVETVLALRRDRALTRAAALRADHEN